MRPFPFPPMVAAHLPSHVDAGGVTRRTLCGAPASRFDVHLRSVLGVLDGPRPADGSSQYEWLIEARVCGACLGTLVPIHVVESAKGRYAPRFRVHKEGT